MTDILGTTSHLPLIGENIQLRPLQMADADEFVAAALESLDTVGRWMNWCHAGYQLADAQQWIDLCAESLREQKEFQLGIFCKQGKHLHGAIGINLIVRLHQFANLGYWLRQSSQGQGIVGEALALMLDFGFKRLQLRRLEVVAAEENLASRRVAEKAGGKLEGILANRLIIDDISYPAAMYAFFPAQMPAKK